MLSTQPTTTPSSSILQQQHRQRTQQQRFSGAEEFQPYRDDPVRFVDTVYNLWILCVWGATEICSFFQCCLIFFKFRFGHTTHRGALTSRFPK